MVFQYTSGSLAMVVWQGLVGRGKVMYRAGVKEKEDEEKERNKKNWLQGGGW